MKLTEARLGRPDRPALVGGQRLDGLARFVQGTDIPELDRVSILPVLFDPAQGKTLRPANVGPVGVDPARALIAQERAGPCCPRGAVLEKVSVVAANVVGLRVEHGQPVDAARAATEPALEPRFVEDVKAAGFAIHVGMQRVDGIGGRIAGGDAGLGVGHSTDRTPDGPLGPGTRKAARAGKAWLPVQRRPADQCPSQRRNKSDRSSLQDAGEREPANGSGRSGRSELHITSN